MRQNKFKYWRIVLTSLSFVLLLGSLFVMVDKRQENDQNTKEMNVEINEIMQAGGSAEEVTKAVQQQLNKSKQSIPTAIYFIVGSLLVGTAILLLYFYFHLVRPFYRMEQFAEEIARGNLDAPLKAERSNLFGSFTWAFDSMREELKQAKCKEEAVIRQNRMMIATISHDIKTPIASIRAYCEGLTLMLDTTPQKRTDYLAVIQRKCDEVTSLSNDLFLNAIHDMDHLVVSVTSYSMKSLFKDIFSLLESENIVFSPGTKIPDVNILADKTRVLQILENIAANTAKYAPQSAVNFAFEVEEKMVICDVYDKGAGILDEDMPFVLQKFYRGKNALAKEGAGLGLYICKMLMEQMKGSLTLRNKSGLHVVLFFEKA